MVGFGPGLAAPGEGWVRSWGRGGEVKREGDGGDLGEGGGALGEGL